MRESDILENCMEGNENKTIMRFSIHQYSDIDCRGDQSRQIWVSETSDASFPLFELNWEKYDIDEIDKFWDPRVLFRWSSQLHVMWVSLYRAFVYAFRVSILFYFFSVLFCEATEKVKREGKRPTRVCQGLA